jgi:hypothetical protein
VVIVMVWISSPVFAEAEVSVRACEALNRPRALTSAQVIVPAAPAQVVVVGAGKKDSWVSPETRNHQPSSKR